MIIAVASLAWAHDVTPTLFVPSTSPGDTELDAQAGFAYRVVGDADTGGSGATVSVRLDRVAFGATGWFGGPNDTGGTGWVGLALVDRPLVRLQVFGEAGTYVRPGASLVARTRGGGIGGNGYQFDVAWGPTWSLERLTNPSWGGPFDPLRSVPEAGVAMALHPNGTQFLRVGMVGTLPTVSYRIDTRKDRRGGFVLESSLGTNLYQGGLATLSLGWTGAKPAQKPYRPL